MSGRRLVIGFLFLLVAFTGALVYFQFFAFYERTSGTGSIEVAGRVVPAENMDRVDATSSPLKLRTCFRTDPALFADLPRFEAATPLNPPPWFRCFDAGALTEDIEQGAALAFLAARDEPDGFNRVVAVYPDGRAYEWRQLAERFTD